MKNILKIAAIALLSIGSLDAKGGGFSSSSGGGGRSSSSFSSSSSSSRSFSSPSPSRPSSSSSWGSSSSTSSSSKSAVAPSNSSSSWGSSSSTAKPSSANPVVTTTPPTKSFWAAKPQTSTRPVSAVESSRYQAAVKSGKTFQTRDAAVADFKAKEATKYSSRFTAEPTTRPDYIPQRYGNNTIVYNQGGGGYGYWNGGGPGLGTFMLYDITSDAIMMNSMMERNHYYVGSAPQPQTVYVDKGGMSFWGWFLTILMTCAIVAIFIAVLKNL